MTCSTCRHVDPFMCGYAQTNGERQVRCKCACHLVIERPKRNTPDPVTELAENEVFVFGSNLAGRHGAGAAAVAARKFGAVFGRGTGPMGRSYAIATKDQNLRPMPLDRIAQQVSDFKLYAEMHPEKTFLVTKIGCGLAGYEVGEIAPMFFRPASNVILPEEFERWV